MYNKLIKFSLIVSLALFSFGFLSNFNNVKAATGTLVATVNILDAEITSQDGGTINGVFTLSNREGVQSGVRYGVQLVSRSSKGDFVVDEKIFDERLQLPENVSLRKSFSYTTPNTLNGKYTLLLVSRNSSNFPFATKVLGEVTLKSSVSGILISPESCVASFDGSTNKTPITPTSALILNNASQVVNISCTATNLSSAPVTANLNVNTKLQSAFGENVDTPLANPVSFSFKANEKKTISFVLPIAKSPQKYFADVRLVSGNNSLGSFSFVYLVPGLSATISNISLDKDFYKRGEIAVVSFLWLSSEPRVSVSAVFKNGSGFSCAKDIESEITPSTVELLVPVTSTCRDPHVLVSLKDSSGNVLDSKDFSVTTTSTNEGKNNTPFILVVVLAALIIVGIYVKKYKSHSGDLPNTANPVNPMMAMLPIIFVAGLLSLVPFSSAYADTYTSTGPDGSQCILTEVNVVPTYYAPNGDIKVTWQILNTCSASVPVEMRATNDIGAGTANPTAVLMVPITLSAVNGSTGALPLEDDIAFNAPSQNGIYKIVFETGVDINITLAMSAGGGEWQNMNCGFWGCSGSFVSGSSFWTNVCLSNGLTSPQDENFSASAKSNIDGVFYSFSGVIPAGNNCSVTNYGVPAAPSGWLPNGLATMPLYEACVRPSNPAIQPIVGQECPPVISLSASPLSIPDGNSSTITWSSSVDTTSCTSSDFPTGGAISGSYDVYPSSSTTYTISCTGPGGISTKTESVSVY